MGITRIQSKVILDAVYEQFRFEPADDFLLNAIRGYILHCFPGEYNVEVTVSDRALVSVVFVFLNEEAATWFALQYGGI